jgi:hypothetical protein
MQNPVQRWSHKRSHLGAPDEGRRPYGGDHRRIHRARLADGANAVPPGAVGRHTSWLCRRDCKPSDLGFVHLIDDMRVPAMTAHPITANRRALHVPEKWAPTGAL